MARSRSSSCGSGRMNKAQASQGRPVTRDATQRSSHVRPSCIRCNHPKVDHTIERDCWPIVLVAPVLMRASMRLLPILPVRWLHYRSIHSAKELLFFHGTSCKVLVMYRYPPVPSIVLLGLTIWLGPPSGSLIICAKCAIHFADLCTRPDQGER